MESQARGAGIAGQLQIAVIQAQADWIARIRKPINEAGDEMMKQLQFCSMIALMALATSMRAQNTNAHAESCGQRPKLPRRTRTILSARRMF